MKCQHAPGLSCILWRWCHGKFLNGCVIFPLAPVNAVIIILHTWGMSSAEICISLFCLFGVYSFLSSNLIQSKRQRWKTFFKRNVTLGGLPRLDASVVNLALSFFCFFSSDYIQWEFKTQQPNHSCVCTVSTARPGPAGSAHSQVLISVIPLEWMCICHGPTVQCMAQILRFLEGLSRLA